MKTTSTPTEPRPVPPSFPAALRDHGLLVTEADGVFGWGAELEDVFEGLERVLTEQGRAPDTRVLRFPPVLPRQVFERSEFAASFPQLFGAVHAFHGDRAAHRELLREIEDGADWTAATRLTDLVLTPAACYPVYPLYSGEQPQGSVTVDVSSFCFRHEPSTEPGRLVAFRQREFVRIGTAPQVAAWLDDWQNRALRIVRMLGLDAWAAPASDAFFGPGGRFLAMSQRDQNLKFEIIAPIGDVPVAVASCNSHREHFGTAFDIRFGGEPAHTGCVGFGQERLAFALVSRHGPIPRQWPDDVQNILWEKQ